MFRSTRRHSAPDFDLLVPEERAKRVEKRIFDNDVVDADFIEIKEASARHFGNDNRAKAQLHRKGFKPLPFGKAMHHLAAIDRSLAKLSVDRFVALIAAAAICVFVLSGGFQLFSSDKAVAAKPFNPLGISYVNVTPQNVAGQDVLVISGVIENRGTETLEVPKILASLSAAKGEFVASMIIQPPILEVKPGNSHGFSAKLRHPGGKTPDIKLSFMQTDVSQR